MPSAAPGSPFPLPWSPLAQRKAFKGGSLMGETASTSHQKRLQLEVTQLGSLTWERSM